MKKFCAVIAVASAIAFGTSSNANAQQPATSAPPAVSPQPAPVIDTSTQGTTVYGWVDGYGRVIPYQSYSVPYQPAYTVRYYYTTPCSTVYYSQPSCYYTPSCYSSCYYTSSCCYTSRRSFRFCR